ncbi:MAG: methylated-DNA--[protein]-cysteine S-methyltransferase [Candidatus Bathyarchaeota archaeon]|nr:methylated-DNA--[protein]-cysteine S-methyltransferase [Candidatus Bathyarchaeota archaeon]
MMQLYLQNSGGVWFGVAYEEKKVYATAFSHGEQLVLRSLLKRLPFDVPFQAVTNPSEFAKKTISLLKDLHDGKDTAISHVDLALETLPAYTQRVLRTVLLVPVGYVASYGSVAKAAGGGARAVGNVMAANPFAPLIPCHRVVKSNFGLGGYGGGAALKTQLLMREKRGYTKPLDLPLDDAVLRVFPVEFVLRRL